jgi:hypothetical protein
MADESSRNSLLGGVNLIVTTILAIAAGWSGFQLNQADKRLKDVETKVAESQEQRADRESNDKKQMAVYDAVVSSLQTDNAKRQLVAKALVTSMLEVDSPLRLGLLAALADSGTPEVKQEVRLTLTKENQFREEENQVSVVKQGQSYNWQDIDYDIFWCEKSGTEAREIAKAIKKKLVSEGARGRIRARLLPDSINARPGYQHTGYIVRLNRGEEKEADELSRVGNQILGQQDAFQQSLSNQPTPWYLSAFVCP